MLSRLRQDHRNIGQLLALLKHKHNAILVEQPISYFLVRDVIDYLKEVSDRIHHPKEELIYHYYLKYHAQDGQLAARLAREHQALTQAGDELKALVEMILLDAVIPLNKLVMQLQCFVSLQEAHMAFEEQEIFATLCEIFTEDDWRHLEQQWQHHIGDDPLFGRNISKQYQHLAERLSQPLVCA